MKRQGDPARAVAYVRVSKDDQQNGPRAQRAAIGAWAKREGVTMVCWRVDHVSGGVPVEDRPRFMRALDDLRRLNAGELVMAKRDRIARDVVIAATAERLSFDAGAKVVTADGVTTEDTPEGQLMRGLLDLFAQYERAMIRARTKAAMLAKTRRGEYTGGQAPFGYSRQGESVVELADEQRVVVMIRQLHGLHGLTPGAIARRLNRASVPCRGSAWHAKSVARVLARGAA